MTIQERESEKRRRWENSETQYIQAQFWFALTFTWKSWDLGQYEDLIIYSPIKVDTVVLFQHLAEQDHKPSLPKLQTVQENITFCGQDFFI